MFVIKAARRQRSKEEHGFTKNDRLLGESKEIIIMFEAQDLI